MEKKAARKKAQVESISQEKKLVAFLDSAGVSTRKTTKLPSSVENVDKMRRQAKAEKAVQEQKKMKTVVKLAAKYRTGRKETYQVGSGWAKNAMERALEGDLYG